MVIRAERSCLLVVDVQERLLPAMCAGAAVVKGCAILMRAAARLAVPVLVSEQYPRGLGRTVAELRDLVAAAAIIEKMHFSCADEPGFLPRLESLRRRQVVIAGIESHVCVLQTALRLEQEGYEPVVVADACSSRTPASLAVAMERLRAGGVAVATVEMIVFEWLNRAGTAEFRELSALIK